MNNSHIEAKRPNASFAHWLKGETHRTIFFPLSIKHCRQRLQNGLNRSFKDSNGWLLAGYEYSGELTGDELQMTVKSNGIRARITFNINGQLYESQAGTGLNITVKNPVIAIVAALGIGAFQLFYLSSPARFILPILLVILTYVLYGWHRSVASDKVTLFLRRIIENRLQES